MPVIASHVLTHAHASRGTRASDTQTDNVSDPFTDSKAPNPRGYPSDSPSRFPILAPLPLHRPVARRNRSKDSRIKDPYTPMPACSGLVDKTPEIHHLSPLDVQTERNQCLVRTYFERFTPTHGMCDRRSALRGRITRPKQQKPLALYFVSTHLHATHRMYNAKNCSCGGSE